MPSLADLTKPQPLDTGSRTSTTAIPASTALGGGGGGSWGSPSVATSQTPGIDTQTGALKAPPSLPFAPPATNGPVYTNQAGRAMKNTVKKQANQLASSIGQPAAPAVQGETLTPELRDLLSKNAPETLSTPQKTSFSNDKSYQTALQKFQQFGNWATLTPEDQATLSKTMGQKAQSQMEGRVMDASKATPDETQYGPGGFQALTTVPATQEDINKYGLPQSVLGQTIDRKAIEYQQNRDKTAADTAKRMNDAANAVGVSMYYDESLGTWVDSTTGKPQLKNTAIGDTTGLSSTQIQEGFSKDSNYGMLQHGQIYQGEYAGLTPGQADAIKKQVGEVKSQYDTAVSQQTEQAKQSEADALVRSGQGGGFLSSQVSGQAATHSIGGTWVGAGGTLKRLQDEHDQAIQKLKDEEGKAIEQAQNAAKSAAMTGNASDLAYANTAAGRIDQIRSDQLTAIQDHETQVKSLSTIQKLEKSDATDTISSLVANGYTDIDKLPKGYLDDLDKHLVAGGMPSGSARMLFATAQKTLSAQNLTDGEARQKAEVDNAKSIVGLLKDVPAGKSITIGDSTYMGTGTEPGLQHGTETDQTGRVTAWSFSPETGKSVTTDLGQIGKPSDGWTAVQTDQGFFNYNKTTKQAIPLQPSSAQTTWQTLFPNGSQSPFRGKNDPMQGQCAAFLNDLYGDKILGDSFDQKQQVLSKYKVDPKDAQVGDTFLMSAGTTGHVGIIAGITQGPDGKSIITALESNYVPPGGAKISSTRTMTIDNSKLKMIARVPTDPKRLPPAGPDSPFTQAIMSGSPTIGGRPISEVLGGAADPKAQEPVSPADLRSYSTQFPKAGILATDTYDQARQKAAAAAKQEVTDGVYGEKTSVAGVKVDSSIASDVEDVLTGRNTLSSIRQTMGRSKEAAAQMKQLRDAIHAVDSKFDFIASDAGGKFVSSEYFQKAQSAINSVLPNIQKVTDLSNEVSRIGVAGVDAELQKGAIQIGNKKVANFVEAQKLIADEIGLALGGGGMSDMKLQLGLDVTDTSMSPEVFASNMEVVKEFLENRKKGMAEQRYSSDVTKGKPSVAPVDLPKNIGDALKTARSQNKDDGKNLDLFLEAYPSYSDIIDQAKNSGKSPTEILDALTQPDT